MIDQTSLDMMRASARFTPAGLPKDKNQDNYRSVQRAARSTARPAAVTTTLIWRLRHIFKKALADRMRRLGQV